MKEEESKKAEVSKGELKSKSPAERLEETIILKLTLLLTDYMGLKRGFRQDGNKYTIVYIEVEILVTSLSSRV